MSDTPCEVCNGVRTILVIDELVTDIDGDYRWTEKRVPCPECTEEGQRWAEAEAAAAVEEHQRHQRATLPAGVFVHVDYHDDK